MTGEHLRGISVYSIATAVLVTVLLSASMASALFFQDGTQDEVLGSVQYYVFKKGDKVSAVARNFDVGIQALLDANNAKGRPKRFKAGDTLVIPSAHVLPRVRSEGIVINLAELRLYLFRKNGAPVSYPISIGKEGWETPLGETAIVRKRANPVWIPTPALLAEDPGLPRSVPAGPDNPLGAFALNLGWAGFAIHGTNAPDSIGKRVSHGCIRMYPEDIRALFEQVETGTRVTVVDEPYKMGWEGKMLYLEVSPPDLKAPGKRDALQEGIDINLAVIEEAEKAKVLWENVMLAAEARDGVPVPVAIAGRTYSQDKPFRIGLLTEKH